MRVIKWIIISSVTIIIFTAFAGMYKFNYLSSKEGYDCDGNKIKTPASVTISDENNESVLINSLYVLIEFRPGSLSPGVGPKEMTIQGSNQPVYISEDIVLSSEEIAASRAIIDSNGSLSKRGQIYCAAGQ